MTDIIPQPQHEDPADPATWGGPDRGPCACGHGFREHAIAVGTHERTSCTTGCGCRKYGPPASLETLLAAVLTAGHAVSFSWEPEDGFLAHLDVFGDDDTVVTHTGIADTPAGALEAAAVGAGLAPDPAERPRFSDEILAERVTELERRTEEDVRYLIRALADACAAVRAGREAAPAGS